MLKKKILGVIVCLMAVFSVVILASSAVKPPPQPETEVESRKDIIMPTYILRDYDGRLAVFSFDSDQPEEILDIFTGSLPEYDQEQLKKGVSVYSPEHLESLIQDYDG